jgi:hypothetical protein
MMNTQAFNQLLADANAEEDSQRPVLHKTRMTKYHNAKNKYYKSSTFKRQRKAKNYLIKQFRGFVDEVIQEGDSIDPWSLYVERSTKKLSKLDRKLYYERTAKKWAKLDRKLYWEHPHIKMADGLSQRDIDKKHAMMVFNRLRKIPYDVERFITQQYL